MLLESIFLILLRFDYFQNLEIQFVMIYTMDNEEELDLQLCNEWMSVARASHGIFVVQTEEPDFFSAYLNEPEKMIQEEKSIRDSFHQPPFERWIKIEIRESEEKKRELQMHLLKEQLEKIDGVRVTSTFVVRVPLSSIPAVQNVISKLDDNYLIDTNAFS